MKKIAVYDPYLDTLGGGEKYILSILKVFNKLGYQVNIFWDKDLINEIKKKFSFQCFKTLEFIPNIFKTKSSPFSALKVLQTLRTFDYFFYVTDGSYFFSSAKKNYVYAMVPYKPLYSKNLLNRLKTFNYQFITHSKFTSRWLTKWGIKNQVIYPYIDDIFLQNNNLKKEKIILSVGRFFPHLHSKQQETIIDLSKKLIRSYQKFRFYKFILAGGLKNEDKKYFNRLQTLVKNNPQVELKPNITFKELLTLYQKAEFFWHFTGFGVDENRHPEQTEHLGIAPLEAMAAGCIVFCYNAGGPKEIIKNGKNGFLFNTQNELLEKMKLLIDNNKLKNQLIQNGKDFIKKNFSYKVFEKNIKKTII